MNDEMKKLFLSLSRENQLKVIALMRKLSELKGKDGKEKNELDARSL